MIPSPRPPAPGLVAPDGRSEEDNFAFPSLLIRFYRDTLRTTATVALQVRKEEFIRCGWPGPVKAARVSLKLPEVRELNVIVADCDLAGSGVQQIVQADVHLLDRFLSQVRLFGILASL